MAWKKTNTPRGVGAAPTFTSDAWSSPIALLELDTPRPRREQVERARVAAQLGLDPGLEFLPHPRHGEEPGRPDRRQVDADLARVGAGRDRHRVDDRQVVVGGALGDVSARQPADHA
jgi:hypothetical protein